ncbi:MAG: glycoside hydrolase family 28 protein [Saprospiraceae bacterium]
MRFFILVCFIIIGHNSVSSRDYNILDYGAKADGKTLNTRQIQFAIDAAYSDGGGRVIIPAGRFLSGSIILKTGVELYLQKKATLLGSTDSRQYIKLNRWMALIMADNQADIMISGNGEIDGQGRQLALNIDSLFYIGQFDSIHYELIEKRPRADWRPQVIELVNCKNIAVRNITIKNSASWVQTYDRCTNLLLDHIRVESDDYWNNDGIDVQDCKNVRITNCFVNSADDGICLKSQSSELFCDSIYISNCTIRSSASAIKFGTVSHGGFKNVRIENIKVFDTFRSAIAIECVDGGTLENVTIDHVNALNTGNAIFIRLGKRNQTGNTATLKNITIKNIRVQVAFGPPDEKYEIRGPELPFFHNPFPSSITGIAGHPVENVLLENIDIQYPGKGNNGFANVPLSRLDAIPEKEAVYPEFSMFGELPAWGFYVRHMNGLTMKNIKLSIANPDYRPSIIFDDVRNLRMNSIIIKGDNKHSKIVLHKTQEVEMDSHEEVMKI